VSCAALLCSCLSASRNLLFCMVRFAISALSPLPPPAAGAAATSPPALAAWLAWCFMRGKRFIQPN
jgi:hypothetical protein